MKATVVGAAGGIGQPLSLLLKQSPLLKELSLYDVVNTPGVATDLSHIDTAAQVTGFLPDDNGLAKALQGTDLVIIPAGMPRKPGMTRDDLFNANASIVHGIAEGIAKDAPKAFVLVISNPVNSMVPIFAEVFKKHGVFDPKRLFGVTTLDVTRAATFLSGIANSNPESTDVPVVGGHSGVTIVPLLSQSKPAFKGDQKAIEEVTNHIQFGGDEVVKAKDGAGSATLSMAYAAAVFTEGLLKALNGEAGVKQCAFVESPLFKDQVEYFASPVELGTDGVKNIPALPKLTEEEQKLLDACLPDLAKSTLHSTNLRHQEGCLLGRREPVSGSARSGQRPADRLRLLYVVHIAAALGLTNAPDRRDHTIRVTVGSTKRDMSQPSVGRCSTPASSSTWSVLRSIPEDSVYAFVSSALASVGFTCAGSGVVSPAQRTVDAHSAMSSGL